MKKQNENRTNNEKNVGLTIVCNEINNITSVRNPTRLGVASLSLNLVRPKASQSPPLFHGVKSPPAWPTTSHSLAILTPSLFPEIIKYWMTICKVVIKNVFHVSRFDPA